MKIIKEAMNNVPEMEEKTRGVVDTVMAKAKLDSDKNQREFEKVVTPAKDIDRTKPFLGAEKQETPDGEQLPKIELEEALFDDLGASEASGVKPIGKYKEIRDRRTGDSVIVKGDSNADLRKNVKNFAKTHGGMNRYDVNSDVALQSKRLDKYDADESVKNEELITEVRQISPQAPHKLFRRDGSITLYGRACWELAKVGANGIGKKELAKILGYSDLEVEHQFAPLLSALKHFELIEFDRRTATITPTSKLMQLVKRQEGDFIKGIAIDRQLKTPLPREMKAKSHVDRFTRESLAEANQVDIDTDPDGGYFDEDLTEDYGWEIDSDKAMDAWYELVEALGIEEAANSLVRALNDNALADCIAYICRQNDLEINSLNESLDVNEEIYMISDADKEEAASVVDYVINALMQCGLEDAIEDFEFEVNRDDLTYDEFEKICDSYIDLCNNTSAEYEGIDDEYDTEGYDYMSDNLGLYDRD